MHPYTAPAYTELVLTTPSTTPIVSLDDVKAEIGYEDDSQDARLTKMLTRATAMVETEFDQTYTPQVWTQYFYGWGDSVPFTCPPYTVWAPFMSCPDLSGCTFLRSIRLLKAPVKSVVVKYMDVNNAEQTLPSADYRLTNSPTPRIVFVTNDLPGLGFAVGIMPVWVEMTCGATFIPPLAEMYCLRLCVEMDARREQTDTAPYNVNPTDDRAGRLLRRTIL